MIRELKEDILKQKKLLAGIPEDMLSFTPEGSTWNGAQCIEHMCTATELYLDQIEEKIEQAVPEKRPYKPGLLADKFIRMQAPDNANRIRFKMKTMKSLEPGKPDPGESVKRLEADLDRTLEILKKLEGKDLRSFKVITAIGPLLKFYVGDALRFVNAHNERHFLQLARITASAKIASAPA